MEWSDLWAWYRQADRYIQEDLLIQLNLKEFLQGLSPKYQLEVIEQAPMEIIKSVRKSLSAYVLKAMKVDTMSVTTKEMMHLLDRNGVLMK